MSADSLLHLAYLLLICAVSAVWSQAARRKAPLRRGSWTLLGSLSADAFPSLATFLSVVTLGKGEYLPWVIYKGRWSTARPSCRWLLMLPQMLSHQVVEERGCSAAADDCNGPVFGGAALPSYLWPWYFHPIPFQDCEWSVRRVARCQMQPAYQLIQGIAFCIEAYLRVVKRYAWKTPANLANSCQGTQTQQLELYKRHFTAAWLQTWTGAGIWLNTRETSTVWFGFVGLERAFLSVFPVLRTWAMLFLSCWTLTSIFPSPWNWRGDPWL